MKSYTDIEQSKKLLEILPLESTDMIYVHTIDIEGDEHYDIDFRNNQPLFDADISAWSLAALLGVLPAFTIDSSDDHYYRVHCMKRYTEWYDNPVDACYELILKLNELNLL